jgi:hypothetical protein
MSATPSGQERPWRVAGQCATPVAADSIPASASELHKLRESPCYTRLSPRRISRWQRAQRTAAGPAAVQDRLHLIWRHHPRQLLRRLQRYHPRCLRSALADVMQKRPPASACAADLPRCQQLADHPGLPLPLVQYAATCPEPPIGLRHNSPHGLKKTGGYQQPPAN